jgi:hypothetical protein
MCEWCNLFPELCNSWWKKEAHLCIIIIYPLKSWKSNAKDKEVEKKTRVIYK